MLINLCETWEKLAPDEFEIHEQGGHGILLKADTGVRSGDSRADEIRIAMYKDRSRPFEMSALDQAKLERYLRRCVQARGWAWEVSTGFLPSSARYSASVTPGGPWRNDKPFFAQYEESTAIALIQAYLPCLAAQRTVTEGIWQHFKGIKVAVKSTATWSGVKISSDSFAPMYKAEESPKAKLQLVLKPGTEDCWLYNANVDYGDRVFYSDGCDRWARQKDIFLSLVGSNAEHEGKLRFLEILA